MNSLHSGWFKQEVVLVDAPGILEQQESSISKIGQDRALSFIKQASISLFVMDAKSGLMPDDRFLLQLLRSRKLPFVVAINKIDGVDVNQVYGDFFALGVEEIFPIAAQYKRGVEKLKTALFTRLFGVESLLQKKQKDIFRQPLPEKNAIRFAVVGRPNAGKSSITNALVREDAVAVSPIAGTTTDSVGIDFSYKQQSYSLFDTAGVRQKGKISDMPWSF